MYDYGLIRRLCAEICAAETPEKVEELSALLHAVIQDDLDDMRTRMAFLRKKYAMIFEQTKSAD